MTYNKHNLWYHPFKSFLEIYSRLEFHCIVLYRYITRHDFWGNIRHFCFTNVLNLPTACNLRPLINSITKYRARLCSLIFELVFIHSQTLTGASLMFVEERHVISSHALYWINNSSTLRWNIMTSSNGIIFRVTGPLSGEFTGHRWIPHTKASAAEFDVFFDQCLNKRLCKQKWGWWF